jgi:hypothetical protein
MGTPPSESEIRLARKLAATFHLNVEERRALPNGEVRMSAIVAAVDASLRESPYFPPTVRPGEGFDGIIIERRADGTLWIHEQYETGVGRFGPVRVSPAQSLAAAVAFYIRALGPASIDGVPINWEA